MIILNDFVHEYKLKNKATSDIKTYQVLSSIGLDIVKIYLKDGPYSSDIGVVNLHPTKRAHWIVYINENFFDICGCSPPINVSNIFIKQNGNCLYSEYKIQGLIIERDSHFG